MDEQAQPEVNLREVADPQKILNYLKGKIDSLESELTPLRIAFCKAVEAGNFGDADVLLGQIVGKQAIVASCAEEYVLGTAFEAAVVDALGAQESN
jgi:hypothetical protein